MEVILPGDRLAYKALQTDLSRDILAQLPMYGSLYPEVVSKEAPTKGLYQGNHTLRRLYFKELDPKTDTFQGNHTRRRSSLRSK